jgi:hypothetical protein
LICPEGTAQCPEIAGLRAWLQSADASARVSRPRIVSPGR